MRQLLLLFISLQAIAQYRLSGTFEESTAIGATSLKFLHGNKFEYAANTCIKSWVGAGTYQVKNSRLSLSFSKADPAKNSHYTLKQHNCKDSAYALFNVFDLKNETLPFAMISMSSPVKKINIITDVNGKCLVSLADQSFPLTLQINYCMKPFTITVKDQSCPVVSVYFNMDGLEVIDGVKEDWEILMIDSASLVLKPGDVWHLKKVN